MSATAHLEIYLLIPLAIVNLPFLLALLTHRKNTMADDFTKLQAAVADLQTKVTAVESEVATLKAGSPSNQSTIDGLTANITAASASLAALVAQPLAVTPTSFTVIVGAAVTDQITVTGGTAPYTFTSTDGLSVDASGAVTGSIATAGDSTITVTDAAGATVSVAVVAA